MMAFARSLAAFPLRRLAAGAASSAITRASVTATTRPSIASSLSRQQFFIQRAAYSSSLTEEEIETRFYKILKDAIGDSDKEFSEENLNFASELGLDSLDHVELILAIEEEFNISISDEDAEHITSTRYAIDYIKENAR